MKLEHVAIWCLDLEKMRYFYQTFFEAKCSDKYENLTIEYASYVLTLPDGIHIELMSMKTITAPLADVYTQFIGLAHLAFSVGSKEKVDKLIKKFILDGYELLDDPCRIKNGYYENTVLDPEGNRLKISV